MTPVGRPCGTPEDTPADVRQLVVVSSSGFTAVVDLLVRDGADWTSRRIGMRGRIGRNGIRKLADRRSGDGTTPAGIFPLGSMTAPDGQTFQFFGNGTNPGVQGAWRQVRHGDCWAATPGLADYNTLTTRPAEHCTGEDEYLANYGETYSAAAVIGANIGPTRSGSRQGEPALAAAIFLHHHSYDDGNPTPTAGCVSLNATDLAAVLCSLVPGQSYFVIR